MTDSAIGDLFAASNGKARHDCGTCDTNEIFESLTMQNASGESTAAFKVLLEMPFAERLQAVVADVLTGRDIYKSIDAHDLAYALEVPTPECPGEEWQFTHFSERQTVEQFAECASTCAETIELLKAYLPKDMFPTLLTKCKEEVRRVDLTFDFLTSIERDAIEEAITARQLEANQSNGVCCIAIYTVNSPLGIELEFEAVVEDDGRCFDLKTPYDARDGNFRDLDNCLTESWS